VPEKTKLTTKELAEREGVALVTVYKWNDRGTGPRYTSTRGRISYDLADVIAWEAEQIRVIDKAAVS
jgi:predicted site-specific integrase-resolvase